MSSIRSILEEFAEYCAIQGCPFGTMPNDNNKLDQTLKEIEEAIDKAKPKTQESPEYICYYDYDFVQDGNLDDLSSYCFDKGVVYGEKSAADDYQSNLKELLK